MTAKVVNINQGTKQTLDEGGHKQPTLDDFVRFAEKLYAENSRKAPATISSLESLQLRRLKVKEPEETSQEPVLAEVKDFTPNQKS